jgi:formylglycine-generating enzyme required for sulfatase activity
VTQQGVSRRWVLGALFTGGFVTALGYRLMQPPQTITTTGGFTPTPPTPKPDPPTPEPEPPTPEPDPPALTPVSGLRSESYTFEIVTGTDTAGQNGQRRSVTVTRWIEDLGNGVLLHLVKIPAGSFMMGSLKGEVDRDDDEDQHRVTFPDDFWMGQFEVTQAQYQVITGQNPATFKGAQNPVDSVSWDDARTFCKNISQSTGRAYRLPTEAEWEYACRAGTNTPFHYGQSITPDLVNYDGNYPYGNAAKGNYRNKTTPVGSFPGNRWGLHDMHGNLWEWCQDEWHDSYAEKPESLKQNGSIAWETTSSSSDTIRVLRGGSWLNNARNCRSANRSRFRTYDSYNLRGFRLILAARTP